MREKRVSKKENVFVSSRFVLPEHREMYVRMKEEERRYVPPELDQDQLGALSELVWQAFQTRRVLTLTYYDGQSPRRLSAQVVHIDRAARRLKLRAGSEVHWLSFACLLHAELAAPF
ncbi:YolD-like family protein [Brevibacillus sp. SAFN-007a]|uniref:YolD-like family protein n=1 Tax=Brevibacillus sp. SAFN-007a TaxID=3436862 RepID=UPI003F7FB2F3